MVKKMTLLLIVVILVTLTYWWHITSNEHLTDVIDFSKKGVAEVLHDRDNQYSIRTKKCKDDFLAASPNAYCTNVIDVSPVNLAPFVGKRVDFDGYYFTKLGDKTAFLRITKIEIAK